MSTQKYAEIKELLGILPQNTTRVFAGNIHGCLKGSAQNGNLQLPKTKIKCAWGSISHAGAKL